MSATLSVGILIHANNHWLGSDLARVADEALSAHEERKYPLAVVKVGACLEGLLKKILQHWGIPHDNQATLGPLIGAVRKSNQAPSPLLERLNEVNSNRNRAPHDKPSPLCQVTEGDSLYCLYVLALIIDWCREVLGLEEQDSATDQIPIFLSVGGPHRLEQAQFLRHLRCEMHRLDVQLRSLTPAEFSSDKPFDQICEILRSCRAALVVGLDRSHAYTVFERERSDRERLYMDQYIPTAWNQIEGAMATALRLPILVLRERRLSREGIFEAENHRHRIRDFDLAVESKGLSPDLLTFMAGWVRDVRSTASLTSADAEC